MNNKLIGNKNNIVFYTDEEGNTKIEVVLQNEDVWLNVNAIAELFDVQRPAIYKHISNIFTEEELEEKSVCSINRRNRKSWTWSILYRPWGRFAISPNPAFNF